MTADAETAPVPLLLAVLVVGQPLSAQVYPDGGLEFLMTQQVHLGTRPRVATYSLAG
jgi:hypothetical protein